MTMMVNGHDQSVTPNNCPHPECRKRFGKKEVQMTGSLENAIQSKFLSQVEAEIKTAERAAAQNKKDVEQYVRYVKQYTDILNTKTAQQTTLDQRVADAKTTLEVLRNAFGQAGAVAQKTGQFAKFVGMKFHLDSKTGGKGHFIEVDSNGSLKCTCTAAAFGGDCWAKKVIASNLQRNDTSWAYLSGQRNFDARVRPTSAYFRIPGYGSRVYSKYVRLG